ncbi:hypothetical protein [Butyrivibrio sp. WCE2006]|nr:hypothetical protein [Butyrivibrio sp. WCE2006]
MKNKYANRLKGRQKEDPQRESMKNKYANRLKGRQKEDPAEGVYKEQVRE